MQICALLVSTLSRLKEARLAALKWTLDLLHDTGATLVCLTMGKVCQTKATLHRPQFQSLERVDLGMVAETKIDTNYCLNNKYQWHGSGASNATLLQCRKPHVILDPICRQSYFPPLPWLS